MVNVTYDSSGGLVSTSSNGTVYHYSQGDISWTLTSAALVWIMIPGVAFVYSGMLRQKNALSMLYLSSLTIAVVTLQWVFWGFSLVYSETGGPFLGNLRYFGLKSVLGEPAITNVKVPSIVFCVFQLMFAAFTPMIALGAVAERVRLGPIAVFVFVWSTVVYDPIAYWTWNPHGWSFHLGSLDFAGGTPVHITSGSAALAISFYLGQRYGIQPGVPIRQSNLSYVYLGTALMWFGWFGFNGGSALAANFRAASAIIVTNVAASAAGLTYLFLDYYRYGRSWSVFAFCAGALVGLVAITPASGFVGAPAAILIGILSSIVCNYATDIVPYLGVDDALGIFATHAVGGIIGNLLTALFAQKSVAGFDGFTEVKGGWLDHNYRQLGIQAAASVAGLAYSFTLTTIILWIMHFIPGLKLRTDEASEVAGMDAKEMDESICNYYLPDTEANPTVHVGDY